jgi:hypothetical protein
MKQFSIIFALAILFAAHSVEATAPAPAPRCSVKGVIQAVEFQPAYSLGCTALGQTCPTDTPTSFPARYSLTVKIESSAYVSGDTSVNTCASLYPIDTAQTLFINNNSIITRTLQFNVGQKIEIQLVDGSRVFNSYTLPGVAEVGKFRYPKNLSFGMRNNLDVKDLQEQLSPYANIYPEKLVTGNFGPATRRAVKRFQAQWNIPQTGYVGPLTRAKLIELVTASIALPQ